MRYPFLKLLALPFALALASCFGLALQALGETPPGDKLLFLGFHMGSPGAATPLITKNGHGATIPGVVAGDRVTKFRVTVKLAADSVLDVTATDGTTTVTMQLNGGTAIPGGKAYALYLPVSNAKPFVDANPSPTALVWNLQLESNVAVDYLMLDEAN